MAFGDGMGHLLEALIRVGGLGRRESTLDAGALGIHDLLELAADVTQDVSHLVALEDVAPLRREARHELAQAGDPLVRSSPGRKAALQEPTERLTQIAIGEQVVGEGVENVVRVEVEALAPIPARVAVPATGRAGRRRTIERGRPSVARPELIRGTGGHRR